MDNSIQQLSLEFKQSLRERYGGRFAKLILFGSYARGDFHEESDVDFLVVLNDEKVQGGDEIFFVSDIVSKLTLKYDKLVSYLPVSYLRLQNAQTIFYRNIRREGLEV
jgi:predicted nucleotidyltransferase